MRGVVALAGIPDLRRAFTEHVCDDAVGKLLGGSPAEVAERCHQTSPVELLPLGVPQRLIHGDRDPIVPFDLVEDYEKVARGSGDDVRLIVLQHAGHFESVSPLSLAFETVQEQVLALMNDDGRR